MLGYPSPHVRPGAVRAHKRRDHDESRTATAAAHQGEAAVQGKRERLLKAVRRAALPLALVAAQPRQALAAVSNLAVSLDHPIKYSTEIARPEFYSLAPAFGWRVIVPVMVFLAIALVLMEDDKAAMKEVEVANGPLGKIRAASFGLFAGFYRFLVSPATNQKMNIFRARMSNIYDGVARKWGELMPRRRDVLPDDWASCTLVGKQRVADSDAFRYTFRFPSMDQTFALQLGQTLSLIALDEQSRVFRLETIPTTSRHTLGYFSIVLNDGDSDIAMSEEERNFSDLVEAMELGEQIAARPGDKRLIYKGESDGPITELHCIATGTRVSQMIPVLQELLPGRDSSVETASLVWANEQIADFAMYDDVERLWYKFKKQLDVSCITTSNLFGTEVTEDDSFDEAIPEEYYPGTMVLVSGPVEFQQNVLSKLRARGFPDGVIAYF